VQNNSFYIETYGCTSNKADSYIISNVLKKSNYTQVSLEDAQFIIINTCGVKEQTENKIKARLENLHKQYKNDPSKYLIIAGCLPYIASNYVEVIKRIVPSFGAIIDLNTIINLPEIFQEIKVGKKNLIIRSDKSIDKVKNARGKLNCYEPNSVIKNIEHQLQQGIKQIYLTSQDCSTYNHNGTTLAELINRIVSLNYKFFLRIGMINPCFLIENIEQIISIFKNSNVYQFLHIPIQSGSNKILQKMERKYQISDIITNIVALKEEFENLTISTDIICGFPGETEYDFLRTINFIKWLKPEILNISKFTPRPGTKAKGMKQLDSKTIKERSVRLSIIFRNSLQSINKNWKNWEGEVLVLHKGRQPNQFFGRNLAYKNIFIDNYNGEFGEFVNVKIYKIAGFNLYGKII